MMERLTWAQSPAQPNYATLTDAQKQRIVKRSNAIYREQTGAFFDWLLDRLEPRPGLRLADISCGGGLFHQRLESYGVWITAVDPSSHAMGAAAARARRDHASPSAAQAEMDALPLGDAMFECVMALHGLDRIGDQLAALAELRRITAPGGRVVIAAMAPTAGLALRALHCRAAAAAGLVVPPNPIARFNLSHLALVQQVLPSARVEKRRDAYLFPATDAALAYYAAEYLDQLEPTPSGQEQRAALLAAVTPLIDAASARAGQLRVDMTAGCFVADL